MVDGYKVLVTGATGFIGSHVIQILKQKNLKLKFVIRRESFLEHESCDKNIEMIPVDNVFSISKMEWERHLKDVNTVIHLAWCVGEDNYLSSAENINCLIGSLELAKSIKESNVKNFLVTGTCFEYDLTQAVLSTNTPLKPNSLYGATKSALYLALENLFRDTPVLFKWPRLFYVYGEGEKSTRLYPYLHSSLNKGEPVALTDGYQVRDYMAVRDVASLLVRFALNEERGAKNICSGIPTTIRQFCESVADQYERRDLLKFGLKPKRAVDPLCIVGLPDLIAE